MYRRLGGPQDRSRQVWKILSPPEFEPRVLQPIAGRHTDWAIPVANVQILSRGYVINETLENNGKLFKLDDGNVNNGTSGVFSSTHRRPSGVCVCVCVCVHVCWEDAPAWPRYWWEDIIKVNFTEIVCRPFGMLWASLPILSNLW